MSEQVLFTIAESAERLRMSKRTFRRRVLPECGPVQTMPGGVVLIRLADLDAWIEAHALPVGSAA